MCGGRIPNREGCHCSLTGFLDVLTTAQDTKATTSCRQTSEALLLRFHFALSPFMIPSSSLGCSPGYSAGSLVARSCVAHAIHKRRLFTFCHLIFVLNFLVVLACLAHTPLISSTSSQSHISTIVYRREHARLIRQKKEWDGHVRSEETSKKAILMLCKNIDVAPMHILPFPLI